VYLSADPDRQSDNDGWNGSNGYEADSNRSSDKHGELKQDLLLATPLLLTPERAPRWTTQTINIIPMPLMHTAVKI